MISFGFFYSTSSTLVNLLERTELFSVSQEIQEQLILALADLTTLVASVATHFHKAIGGLTTASLSVNIYETFPGQIQSFKERCGKISEAMWRHQLANENIDTERGKGLQCVLEFNFDLTVYIDSFRCQIRSIMARPRGQCSRPSG